MAGNEHEAKHFTFRVRRHAPNLGFLLQSIVVRVILAGGNACNGCAVP